jgi:GNAT superfamily N-acetyltransferase
VRNITSVVLGALCFPTWYPSFYPSSALGPPGSSLPLDKLYVCQWCFKYTSELLASLAHGKCCAAQSKPPPGVRIYEHDKSGEYTIYRVDGEQEKVYAQCLSLFAKLWLDNKSVFFDVAGFDYFVLVHEPPKSRVSVQDGPVRQAIGFFSKEKHSWDSNNLACILVFPPWQRRGLGKLLMGVSYSLAQREGQLGGPEKPLSALGRSAYERFWAARVARLILGTKVGKKAGVMTVEELSKECWMSEEDVLGVLKGMGQGVWERGKGEGEIRVSKGRVREWVERERLGLGDPVHERGFLDVDEDGEEEES